MSQNLVLPEINQDQDTRRLGNITALKAKTNFEL